ncbi:MAG: LPS export ABC transporter periplasmic protein LptC [Bacteroidales bacterium]|nr:LPS export ABC transporter periplasmic protein LptC [Bacteroidales bacterium]
MNRLKLYSVFAIAILATILLLICSSCSNSMEEVREFTQKDSLPVQTAFDIEMLYSESGIVRYKIIGSQVDQYEASVPYTEFTNGLEVLFYDSLGQVQSKLTADYGVNWESKREMEAKYNVVVISYAKEQQMYSEHLVWDQNKKKIYTEEFVTIVTKDKTLYGENGMESDETFDKWSLKDSKAKFQIEEKSE